MQTSKSKSVNQFGRTFAVCLFIATGFSVVSLTTPIINPAAHAQSLSCKGAKKTCKAIKSCKVAVYKLYKCKQKRLDRDKDGIPCEKMCGKSKTATRKYLKQLGL